jgi:hypothetical protein
VLARYRHLDGIPADASDWDVSVRGAARLAGTLARQGEAARLFRRLATLLTDLPVFDSIEELRWRGPRPEFENYCASIRAERLRERAGALVEEGRPDT